MLTGDQIAEANLIDWRELGQGLHARYVVDDFSTGAKSVGAVGGAGDALGHHPLVTMGDGYVDLKLHSCGLVDGVQKFLTDKVPGLGFSQSRIPKPASGTVSG